MLKYPKIKGTSEPDFNKSPTLRVKVPQWQGVWKSEIFDENQNKLYPDKENPLVSPLDFLKKGVTVACLLRCGGIWFTNGKFTVTWSLKQAVVQKPQHVAPGKCLIKLNSLDMDTLKSTASGSSSTTVAQAGFDEDAEYDDDSRVRVVDSDDEGPVASTVFLSAPAASSSVEEVVKSDVFEPQASAVAAAPEGEAKPKKKIVRKKETTTTA
jgi:hypothetical protein